MICPNCQVEAAITEQHYGALYTCNDCRAVYFINFEGRPEFDNVSPDETSEQEINEQETSGFETSLEPLIDSIDVVSFDNKLDEQFGAQSQNSEAGLFEDARLNLDVVAKERNAFTEAVQDITDFGNTETQLAGLNYNLKIIGLDTHETKRKFQEAIEDSKLGLDVNMIMKNIKNGQVQFEKLNPVKAYILAKRLRFLDIEKYWKQNAMS